MVKEIIFVNELINGRNISRCNVENNVGFFDQIDFLAQTFRVQVH